jgi:hypothetical protein
VLKSGKKIEAKIIERTDRYIKVDYHGVSLTYYTEDIESIDELKIEQPSQSANISPLNTEKSPSQIFKDASPAVVIITTKAIGEIPSGTGSGFIIKENGIILTCLHVVSCAQGIEVKTKDGRVLPMVGIIAFDPIRDVCLLKVAASGLAVIPLGSSEKLEIGAKVFTIGAPLNLAYTISDGLFSGYRKLFSRKTIQLSAPISPGNSGGPVIDIYGNAVGIASFYMTPGQNLNFATPIDKELKDYIDSSLQKISEDNMKRNLNNFAIAYSYADTGLDYKTQWDTNHPLEVLIDCMYKKAHCGDKTCDLAIENYERAISSGVMIPYIFEQVGSLYEWCHKDFDKALLNIKKAIEIEPQEMFISILFDMNITILKLRELEQNYNDAKKIYKNFLNDIEELSAFFPDLIALMKIEKNVDGFKHLLSDK